MDLVSGAFAVEKDGVVARQYVLEDDDAQLTIARA